MNAISKTYRTANHSKEKLFVVHTAQQTTLEPMLAMMMRVRYAQVLNIILKDRYESKWK